MLRSTLTYLSFRRMLHSSTQLCNENATNVKQTHFGYQVVDEDKKADKVHEVFENVAQSYDKMNDALSFGIHRLWKNTFINKLSPTPGTLLLDVAGGSGDIAFRFLDYVSKSDTSNKSHVTVCDINEAMLEVGKRRSDEWGYSSKGQISWLLGDAENLPVASDSMSAYTISFGIRNVTHIDKVLDEAYRVLKPGGRFLCLEFSHVENELIRSIYDYYSFTMIPVMGQIIAGQWKPYQYLVESIRKFPNQETFKSMIQSAGFSSVTYENLTFGAVAIHSGFKL